MTVRVFCSTIPIVKAGASCDLAAGGDVMRTLAAIAADLRAEAPCVVGRQSVPCSDCCLMIEAAEALELIDATVGVKLRKEATT